MCFVQETSPAALVEDGGPVEPGEAREADIGIAGGNGEGLIFKKGEIIRKVKEEELIEELMKEIENL